MTNKQGLLIGALGSYFTELIAENLRSITERINELEGKALYQKGYSEGQTLRVDELEKQVSLLRDRTCDHSTNLRINELEKNVRAIGTTLVNVEDLEERLAAFHQRLTKLEATIDRVVNLGAQLEEKVKMIDTRAANLVLEKLGGMGLGINQLCIYVESDQFRERIFEIVDMALQHTKLSIKEAK